MRYELAIACVVAVLLMGCSPSREEQNRIYTDPDNRVRPVHQPSGFGGGASAAPIYAPQQLAQFSRPPILFALPKFDAHFVKDDTLPEPVGTTYGNPL